MSEVNSEEVKPPTIGEVYGPAMEIKSQVEADAYFEQIVTGKMDREGLSREVAADMTRQNLGCYAGYYNAETRERVERLFCCSHPIFGAIAKEGEPTPEEAFRMGQDS